MDLVLTGYRYSVYTRSARMGLMLGDLDFEYREANPFDPQDTGADAHPMRRVPVLQVDGTNLFETSAILTWVDAQRGWQAPPLVQARAAQVGGIADAYAYWPLVRQVFSHGWFRPALGAEADPDTVAKGLEAAGAILDMLNDIAAEARVLVPGTLTRADCHLAPMIDAFQMVPAGADMLAARSHLAAWYAAICDTTLCSDTRPDWNALNMTKAP